MTIRRLALASAFVLLGGCDLAPDYRRPETMIPAAYKEDPNWQPAKPADDIPRGSWWSLFGDATLDTLEARVTSANQDLKAAMARLDEAKANATYARSAYFPSVTLSGSANRQRLSDTIANTRPNTLYSDLQTGLNLNYEIDLFGRVRNTVRAAKSQAEASAGDLAALDLATHAELASDYFTLRSDDAKAAILDETVTAYQKAFDLTNSRHNGGAATLSDVAQADTQLQSARTSAEDIRLQRAQLLHAIAILVGEPASTFDLPPAESGAEPPAVGAELPGRLLERRPDIAAAERRVAAANAQIGVARAAFFPVFSLTGSYGVESADPGMLFSAPSRLWSLGTTALVPLFDGGERSALSAQARAAYDETAANYRTAVLGAYRDVEDGLAARRQLDLEAGTETRAVAASQTALDQAIARYQGGIVTYLEVITTQNAALQTRLTAADIAGRRLNASVTLIRALGGGWSDDLGETVAAISIVR